VQNEASAQLLREAGITQVTVAGDTRFDRVRTVAAQKKDIPLAAALKPGSRCWWSAAAGRRTWPW
jgi:3-deoxy-D-manno-octulosonic-acid transferase